MPFFREFPIRSIITGHRMLGHEKCLGKPKLLTRILIGTMTITFTMVLWWFWSQVEAIFLIYLKNLSCSWMGPKHLKIWKIKTLFLYTHKKLLWCDKGSHKGKNWPVWHVRIRNRLHIPLRHPTILYKSHSANWPARYFILNLKNISMFVKS